MKQMRAWSKEGIREAAGVPGKYGSFSRTRRRRRYILVPYMLDVIGNNDRDDGVKLVRVIEGIGRNLPLPQSTGWPARVGAALVQDANTTHALSRWYVHILTVELGAFDDSGRCAAVAALYARRIAGDEPTDDEWKSVIDTASAAFAADRIVPGRIAYGYAALGALTAALAAVFADGSPDGPHAAGDPVNAVAFAYGYDAVADAMQLHGTMSPEVSRAVYQEACEAAYKRMADALIKILLACVAE